MLANGTVHINSRNSSGLNALHLAAKEGHVQMVELLIQQGIDLHAATRKGNTALHIAALSGHLEIVQILVNNNVDVNVLAERSFTPLYMAAQENYIKVVKFLIKSGADPNLLTDDGFSPLAVAIQQQHAEIVSYLLQLESGGKRLHDIHLAVKKDDCKATALLLQNGADPNVAAGNGFTPLHIAAHYGYVRIAGVLIQKGAAVNRPAKDGIQPLHVAAKFGKPEMTSLLLEFGADPNARTRDGLTALHLASRNGHVECVDALLLSQLDLKSKTKSGLTALHVAAQGDADTHVSCARLILYHGLHVDEVSRDLLTPLHIAAHCGHVNMAEYLLNHYANPDAKALNGFAALHIAVKKRRIPVIILLLKCYADINITTESGLTPLHIAAYTGAEEVFAMLMNGGARVDMETSLKERPLHFAVRAGHIKLVDALLKEGSDVSARASDSYSCLHIAAKQNQPGTVKLLLRQGADKEAEANDGYRPLHVAVREGSLDAAKVLIDSGACITSLTSRDFTPLHLAAKFDKLPLVKLLLAHGASPDMPGSNYLTPLHLAVFYGCNEIGVVLLQSGASANSTAINGYTALHMAAKRNSLEMAQRLTEHGADVDAQTKFGAAPAHLAAKLGHTEFLRYLHFSEANMHITSPLNVTPLHMAAEADKTDACRCLIEDCRVFIEPKTNTGFTPLHCAVYHNAIRTAVYLIRTGSNPNVQNDQGFSCLHVAAQQGNTQMVAMLLEAGCQPNLCTNSGATALAIASKLKYVTVVDLLKKVTTYPVTMTLPQALTNKFVRFTHHKDMDSEIRVSRSPETIQEFSLETEQEDEIDYPETEDMNYMSPEDRQFFQDDSLRPFTRGGTLARAGSGTGSTFDSYASFNRYLTVGGSSRPTSGTSNISCYTTGSYGDNLHNLARLSISDLANMRTLEATASAAGDNDLSQPGISHQSGFLISFVADAKGCRMRGARGSGLCVVIPARSCEQPQRVTLRYIKRHKLLKSVSVCEDEGLAARVLELGPVGTKFAGPIILEVPHVASLSNGEREIVVMRLDPAGEEWVEHKQTPLDEKVQKVLNMNLAKEEEQAKEDLNTDRIQRIVLDQMPQYLALVSRLKRDSLEITASGGVLSSSIDAKVQFSFPEKAVKKDVKISLQVLKMKSEILDRVGLNELACSPVVTIEPRKRQFHERFTICMPRPVKADGQPLQRSSGIRLLRSVTDTVHPAVWDDITEQQKLEQLANGVVTFTSKVSARFWLVESRTQNEALRLADAVYRETIQVPYMAKFFVFAKRHAENEARLRLFCMTDDRHEHAKTTLESQENFIQVAKSRDVEVVEGSACFLDWVRSNICPVHHQQISDSAPQQMHIKFWAFKENRTHLFVQIRDLEQEPAGRLEVYSVPKTQLRGKREEELREKHVCSLNITLPGLLQTSGLPAIVYTDADFTINFASAAERKRDPALCEPNLSPDSSADRALLRLSVIAEHIGADWVRLAERLGVEDGNVGIIRGSGGGEGEEKKAYRMLHHWAEFQGTQATGPKLEAALREIGRDDINPLWLNPSFRTTSRLQPPGTTPVTLGPHSARFTPAYDDTADGAPPLQYTHSPTITNQPTYKDASLTRHETTNNNASSVHHASQPVSSIQHASQPVSSIHHASQPVSSIHHASQPVSSIQHGARTKPGYLPDANTSANTAVDDDDLSSPLSSNSAGSNPHTVDYSTTDGETTGDDSEMNSEPDETRHTTKKITRIIRLDPDGKRKEYIYEGDVTQDTNELIEKAIADAPYGAQDRDQIQTQTRRVVVKKQVVTKTVIKDDGREETSVETSQEVEQDEDDHNRLQDDPELQQIVNSYLNNNGSTTDGHSESRA